MTSGKKFALVSVTIGVLAIGGRVLWQYHLNNQEAPAAKPQYEKLKLTDDQAVVPRKLHPDSLKDEKDLVGHTLWVFAGGQMNYYPCTAHHADYSHKAGTLLGAEPMLIKDAFEQAAAPKQQGFMRIPAGQKQMVLAFTLPNSDKPTALYATPIGFYEGGVWTLYTDEAFFYDDPHTLYKHWGPEMWAHVDKHEAVVGMNENQAMLALGQVSTPSSQDFGNRSVTYDNLGHPIKMVFVDNKATSVTPEQP